MYVYFYLYIYIVNILYKYVDVDSVPSENTQRKNVRKKKHP